MLDVQEQQYLAQKVAIRYLGYRARTEQEMREFLKKKFPLSIIDTTIKYLYSISVLDDLDFAKQWAAYKKSCGKGKKKVAYELKQKGVSESNIQTAIEEYFKIEDIEEIKKVAEKKLNCLKQNLTTTEKKNKLFSFLYSRGFEIKQIKIVIQNIF